VAKLVVFVMDGVLVDIESSWVYVHRHFGVNNDHSLLAYLRGEIDDLEFIRRDIALWRRLDPSITASDVAAILADAPLMPGAQKAVSHLRRNGTKTAIVSAGIDLLAERVASELGIDLSLANGFVTDASGRLSGEGVLRVKLTDKGDGVTEAARHFGMQKNDVVSVGNSKYDISMFESSGKGIAFCPSDDDVRNAADSVILEKDLSRVLDEL
jgi:phosphoserine phosphatase